LNETQKRTRRTRIQNSAYFFNTISKNVLLKRELVYRARCEGTVGLITTSLKRIQYIVTLCHALDASAKIRKIATE